MTLHTYAELEQGTDEWLEARRGLLTASVMGKLITPKTVKVANNDDARALTALLVSERITGWCDPTYFNGDMQRGNDIEPIARDWYAEKYEPVRELGFMVLEQDGYRIGFSPDGLVGEKGILEIKAPRAKGHLMTHLSGEMPLFHMAQVQTGLLVSGREWCDFLSYYGGLAPFVKRVYRDEAWLQAIVDAAKQFETKAAEMQAEFERVTAGLPKTERPLFDLDMVL